MERADRKSYMDFPLHGGQHPLTAPTHCVQCSAVFPYEDHLSPSVFGWAPAFPTRQPPVHLVNHLCYIITCVHLFHQAEPRAEASPAPSTQ